MNFLEDKAMPWFESRQEALANRVLIREQAFGEALDPDRLERLSRCVSGTGSGMRAGRSYSVGSFDATAWCRSAAQPRCLVAIEACASAHYWVRELERLGHEVRLIARLREAIQMVGMIPRPMQR